MSEAWEVTGVVSRVFSNDVKGGKFTLWSFKLVDDDTYYNTKFDNPKLEEGDNIKFLAKNETYNGKKRTNVDADSIKRVKAPAKKTGGSGGGAQGRDSFWANKEERDIRTGHFLAMQGCYGNAIKLMEVALANGLLPKVEKAAAAKKLDLFMEQVTEVANGLLDTQNAYAAKKCGDVEEEAEEEKDDADYVDWDKED